MQRRYKVISPYYTYTYMMIKKQSVFFFKKKRMKWYLRRYNPIKLYFLLYNLNEYKIFYIICVTKKK